MVDPLSEAGNGDVHIGGWTVVRAPATLSATERAALVAHVRELLVVDASVVLDTRRLTIDGGGIVDDLRALREAADASGATLAFAVPDQQSRAALEAAGLTGVHDSVDTAVGDTAPPRRDESTGHVLPAAGDSQLVATEDILGPDPNRRA